MWSLQTDSYQLELFSEGKLALASLQISKAGTAHEENERERGEKYQGHEVEAVDESKHVGLTGEFHTEHLGGYSFAQVQAKMMQILIQGWINGIDFLHFFGGHAGDVAAAGI